MSQVDDFGCSAFQPRPHHRQVTILRLVAAMPIERVQIVAVVERLEVLLCAELQRLAIKPVAADANLLRQAGLVVSVKDGQFIYYSISTTVMDEMLKWIMQFKSPQNNKKDEEV